MSTYTAQSTPTSERRLARLFGLEGDNWMRHANPVSVWTRFAFLPMLAVAVWSRDWIGWWSVALVVLALIFMMINPLLFRPPRSTRNWASKAVLGERIWADRTDVEIPAKYRASPVSAVTYALQLPGFAALAYGLVSLDLVAVAAGLMIIQTAKSWSLDRMVLLFDDMKARPEYASWDY
jgi:hypothetical protein